LTILLICLGVLAAGAVSCVAPGRMRPAVIGPLAATGGSGLAAAAGLLSLLSGTTIEIVFPWRLAFGTLRLGLDPLSAFFVFLIGLVGALAAIYGRGYLAGRDVRKSAACWCWYNLLMAAMLLVVVARNGFVFLLAWEVMSLTSFFLVMHDHEKEGVMRAGWIYMIATHLGTAFLLVMFLLLGRGTNLDFASYSVSGGMGSLIFACALVGFGTKAGLVPLHVWLPEAHPAAPSHVSALMSGVMIKTGIYGLLRVIMFIGPPTAWWGWALVAAGILSGLLGVLSALAQRDLKRLLAYSSVENIGIIAMGLGLGLLGIHFGHPVVAALGFCGALLHTLNHGLFKGLLFMGAGSVLHATGTGELDRLGGLIKRMPVTGGTFLVGAAAISGLPPLNGFVSEFLVYAAGFTAVIRSGGPDWSGLGVVAGLALIGGLAAACFLKAFGIVFLGVPRGPAGANVHEASGAMEAAMLATALLCITVGLGAPWVIRMVLPVTAQLMPAAQAALLTGVIGLLKWIPLSALVLIGSAAVLLVLRTGLLRRRSVQSDDTWGCGYLRPSARMQYTASSFAQPSLGMFARILRPHQELDPPGGLFPHSARLATHTSELFVQGVYEPAIRALQYLAALFRRLQQGRTTHLYILYIVITMLLLLTWNLA
jgi:hydrogenase-4 component B